MVLQSGFSTLGPELQAILTSIASAVIYSFVFYAKKFSSSNREKFDQKKLAATVIVAAVIGAAYGYYGIPVTKGKLFEQLAAYAGTIALVESVLKTVFRVIRNKTE